jgi:acrylyl-CoA reductase (NADPH)
MDLLMLERMSEEVPLEEAVDKAHSLMGGKICGRIVVRIS